jgi:hypothetical protein
VRVFEGSKRESTLPLRRVLEFTTSCQSQEDLTAVQQQQQQGNL